tara:strand:+ start:9311 stop:9772 length:462 start_codon:yes stop_codon:yes gene_type:complete
MASQQHDTGYKELFSHPEFVQQLIEGFAPPEIGGLMDFSTLQIHIRLLHYVACFYDHLLKSGATTVATGLPPVLPIVLYNGSPRWTARQNIYDLIQPEPPEFLRVYQPHLRFYLVDEGRYTEEELAARQSPLSGVFGIENADSKVSAMCWSGS